MILVRPACIDKAKRYYLFLIVTTMAVAECYPPPPPPQCLPINDQTQAVSLTQLSEPPGRGLHEVSRQHRISLLLPSPCAPPELKPSVPGAAVVPSPEVPEWMELAGWWKRRALDEKQPSLEGSVAPAMGAWVAWEGKRPQMSSSPDKIQLHQWHSCLMTAIPCRWNYIDIEMETQMLSCKGSPCCVCLRC